MPCHHAKSFVAVAALMLLAGAAWAESAPPTPIAATQVAMNVQTVDVTGHYDNGIGTSDAASEGVVRGERLTDLPLLRPGEVLETRSRGWWSPNILAKARRINISFAATTSTTAPTSPAVSTACPSMPYRPMRSPRSYSDLNFLIPELVDHIDYRKGPYFAQNGDFSSAGSADIAYVATPWRTASLLDLTDRFDDGYKRGLSLPGSFPLLVAPPTTAAPKVRPY